MPQNTFRKHLSALCAANKIPVVSPHELRHSFASLAYSLKIPIKVTRSMGGWSDYNTMLKIYTHLAQKDVDSYANEMTEFFDEPAK